MSSYKYIVLSILLIITVVGCVAKKEQIRQDPNTQMLQLANAYTDQGNHLGAAAIYKKLAMKTRSPNREKYLLKSVYAFIDAGDHVSAMRVADSINPANITSLDRSKLFLLIADIDMHSGKAEAALENLDRISPNQLNDELKLSYHRSRAAAHSIMGNILESVSERVKAGEYLLDPAEIDENNARIMEALSTLPERTLRDRQPPRPSKLGGWMALTRLTKHHRMESPEMARLIEHWRSDFPGHPAAESFIREFLEHQYREFEIPESIAVLLPQSGPYAAAGIAIKEGISAAYFDQGDRFAPAINFYDTQGRNAYALYQQAIIDGADFVIGPLIKDNILALLQGGELSVPVLALNRLNDPVTHPYLVEFGLSPEDETEQAASSAWSDGLQKALVIAPSTNFGHRLASHFSEYWQRLGGEILEVQTYNPKESDFSIPIKRLLDLDESEFRHKQLRKFLGDIKFNPRRRNDVDFIFVVARPREARLIRPQLQFYRASRVPIYATSHIYSGHPNPSMDQDLSEVIFCDISWLLDKSSAQGSLTETLEEVRQNTPSQYLRLLAMGVDVYGIVPHLNRLRRDSAARYKGLTGVLSISTEDRIKRQLHCAQFVNGLPKSRGLAPHLQTGREMENADLFRE